MERRKGGGVFKNVLSEIILRKRPLEKSGYLDSLNLLSIFSND